MWQFCPTKGLIKLLQCNALAFHKEILSRSVIQTRCQMQLSYSEYCHCWAEIYLVCQLVYNLWITWPYQGCASRCPGVVSLRLYLQRRTLKTYGFPFLFCRMDIYWEYLEHILNISSAYLGQNSGISCTHFVHIWIIS